MTFSDVPKGAADPINELKKIVDSDPYPSKIDLGVGVYRNEHGVYHEFESIREAKNRLDKADGGHDYNPTTGIPAFNDAAARLLFGADSPVLDRLATIQTVAGTGANHVGAAFLSKFYPEISSPTRSKVYIGTPAWGNYRPLFQHAGLLVETYTHYDRNVGKIDFESILKAVEAAPEQSIFVLQGVCHNPTGMDFTKDQWKQLAEYLLKKNHFAFLDVAYQGFGSGAADAGEDDVWAVRHFVEKGVDMLVAQSFSKNMGLYSERVGALHVVCKTPAIAANVKDTLRSIIRWEVSSTPAYGAQLVEIILNDSKLYDIWANELSLAGKRLVDNRRRLHQLLTETQKTPGTWDHILQEKGLFSYTYLTGPQIDQLREKHHVYLPGDGRVNIAGINENNVERLAEAIDAVVKATS